MFLNSERIYVLQVRGHDQLPVCYIIFRKGIPDNDVEFLDFELLEKSIHEGLNKRMQVHYTHTYASYEKPHIESNHILLRWLIEKGYNISLLSANDILDIINRLNNYPT